MNEGEKLSYLVLEYFCNETNCSIHCSIFLTLAMSTCSCICLIVGNHRMYFIENGKVLGGEVMVGEWTEGVHLQKHACGRVLGNKTEWEKWQQLS